MNIHEQTVYRNLNMFSSQMMRNHDMLYLILNKFCGLSFSDGQSFLIRTEQCTQSIGFFFFLGFFLL